MMFFFFFFFFFFFLFVFFFKFHVDVDQRHNKHNKQFFKNMFPSKNSNNGFVVLQKLLLVICHKITNRCINAHSESTYFLHSMPGESYSS